jgi:hypothetical protein
MSPHKTPLQGFQSVTVDRSAQSLRFGRRSAISFVTSA